MSDANSAMPTAAPAGWYDDGTGTVKWWDGLNWTQAVPAAPPTARKRRTSGAALFCIFLSFVVFFSFGLPPFAWAVWVLACCVLAYCWSNRAAFHRTDPIIASAFVGLAFAILLYAAFR